MVKKIVLFFAALLICVSASATVFADTSFVDAPLQLYPASPKENDMVTLTAIMGNTADYVFSGSVAFYDGDTILGRKDISIPVGGVATAQVRFAISAGSHSFFARVENPSQVLSNGKTQPLGISIEPATLPKYTVSPSALKATVVDSKNSPDAALLSTIDTTESKVLGVLPASVRTSLESTVSSVDMWRAQTAASADKKSVEAKKQIDGTSVKKTSTSSKKNVPEKTSSDSPFAYVAYLFYGLIAFLLGNQFIFYVGGIILIILVIRFIFRRARK